MNKILFLLIAILLLLSSSFALSTATQAPNPEFAGDITITSAKLGLKTFLKGIAETSQDALKTIGKKVKDIPSFYKSARLWKESLQSIEKTYGKETSEAITKLTGRIIEDEADAFMRLSPELIETYGKESVQSSAKIAEKYALELDGASAEALAKLANKRDENR